MAEVHLIGQIVGADDFEDRSLFSKWAIRSGSCWNLLEGRLGGQTQLTTKVVDESGKQRHSWSHPLDVHLYTKGLQGWPKLELQIWGADLLGKCNICAYGYLCIPSKPGRYRLTCSTWRPIGDLRRRIIDWITGYRMHLVDPSDVVGHGINRHAIHSQSMGSITVELSVILRGFEKYGVDL